MTAAGLQAALVQTEGAGPHLKLRRDWRHRQVALGYEGGPRGARNARRAQRHHRAQAAVPRPDGETLGAESERAGGRHGTTRRMNVSPCERKRTGCGSLRAHPPPQKQKKYTPKKDTLGPPYANDRPQRSRDDQVRLDSTENQHLVVNFCQKLITKFCQKLITKFCQNLLYSKRNDYSCRKALAKKGQGRCAAGAQ